MQLPPAESVDEYATFLAKAIRTHLDDDWMEQSCHENIGDEVAKLFREAVAKVNASTVQAHSCAILDNPMIMWVIGLG